MDQQEELNEESTRSEVKKAGVITGVGISVLYLILCIFLEEGFASNVAFLFISPTFFLVYHRKYLNKFWFVTTISLIMVTHGVLAYEMPNIGNNLSSYKYHFIPLLSFPLVYAVIYLVSSKIVGDKLD